MSACGGNPAGTDNVELNEIIKSLMQRLSCVHTYGPFTVFQNFFFFFSDALSPYISFSLSKMVLNEIYFRSSSKIFFFLEFKNYISK